MAGRAEIRKRGLRSVFIAGGVAWILAPVAALVILASLAQSVVLSDREPTWVPVRAAVETSTPAQLALVWHSPLGLVAPKWSGTVQSVKVESGATVETGSRIVTVNGVTRVAAATAVPLYRPIALGDRGADVAALNEFLRAMGHGAGTGDLATWQTRAAIASFAESIGAGQALTFDPSWVLWLSEPNFTVREVSLTPGSPVPPEGTEVVSFESELQTAVLVPDGTIRMTNDEPGGEARSASAIETAAQELPEASTLMLATNGTLLAVDEGRTRLETAALEALRPLVKADSPGLPVRIVREPQAGEWTVPASALQAGSGSSMCVFVRNDGGEHAQRVELIAENFGQVVVRGGLDLSDRVRVPPSSDLPPCV